MKLVMEDKERLGLAGVQTGGIASTYESYAKLCFCAEVYANLG